MKNIDFSKKYMLNEAYTIIPDKTRAIIATSKGYDALYPISIEDTGLSWLFHPVYAVIFSFFDGRKILSETLKDISEETGIAEEKIMELIQPLFNNTEHQIIRYEIQTDEKGTSEKRGFYIPKLFIVENNNPDNYRKNLYKKEDFYIKKELWDFKTFRLSKPITLTLMLNNQCLTDCIYCYANKDYLIKNYLSTEKILSLIKEANDIGVLCFEIAGGEVMLHKDWDIIVAELIKYNFVPHISTKLPLTEPQIKKLKEIGISKIQLSIDAWNAYILQQMIGVNENYLNRFKKSLELLEKNDMEVVVKSVVTRHNKDIKEVDLLLTNLIKFSNISRISVAPAEYSIYKREKGFLNFRTSLEEWNAIADFVTNFGLRVSKNITPQGCITKKDIITSPDEKDRNYNSRALCTGNVSSMYILPDGQVTICEELYWSPKFIIGDVTQQHLMDIWNSEKALKLYNMSQDDFRLTSACRYCPGFSECRLRLGVCWKQIYQAYGEENWDLPDPKCPLAPPPINEFFR